MAIKQTDPTQRQRAFRAALTLLALQALGCGTLASITRDPTALTQNDKAPLPVVVQRADAASVTAMEVHRLLTTTPVGEREAWPEKIQLTAESISAFEVALAEHPYYEAKPFRIVPALVWASGLSGIARADSTALSAGDTPASVVPNVTPVALAPAPTFQPSLLAAISPNLGAGYETLQLNVKELATLKARMKSEELAQDKEGISDTEAKQHEVAAAALSKRIDTTEEAFDHATKAYVAACRVAASQVPATVRDRYLVAIVNLREAVREANRANAAAVMQYTQLLPGVVRNPIGFKDVLIEVAKANVSDYVFERTGKRVKLSGFKPAVTFDNGKVAIVLNGLSLEDIGQVDLVELAGETVLRTERFAVKAATLLVTTSESGESLDFEADVLDGILDGFADAGCKPGQPAQIAAQTSTEIRARAANAIGSSQPLSFKPF
jgi:hypothetical protein